MGAAPPAAAAADNATAAGVCRVHTAQHEADIEAGRAGSCHRLQLQSTPLRV